MQAAAPEEVIEPANDRSEPSADELSAWVLQYEGIDPDWSNVDPEHDTTLPGRCTR